MEKISLVYMVAMKDCSRRQSCLSEGRLRWNMKLHFRRRNMPLRLLNGNTLISFTEIKTEFITDFPITPLFTFHCTRYTFQYHPRYVISIRFSCIPYEPLNFERRAIKWNSLKPFRDSSRFATGKLYLR